MIRDDEKPNAEVIFSSLLNGKWSISLNIIQLQKSPHLHI